MIMSIVKKGFFCACSMILPHRVGIWGKKVKEAVLGTTPR